MGHRAAAALSLLVVVGALALGTPAVGDGRVAVAACSAEVVLDPGHGGTDPGAINQTYQLVEKALTLDVAQQAAAILTGDGHSVALTRTDNDTTLGNSERGDFANACGARVFISIHFNSSTSPQVDYTKAFWGKRNKDLAFTQTVHAALWPSLQTDSAGAATNLTDGGVGQFANGALLHATMPSALAETVFLSNPAEAARLADPSGARIAQIARAIALGAERGLAP